MTGVDCTGIGPGLYEMVALLWDQVVRPAKRASTGEIIEPEVMIRWREGDLVYLDQEDAYRLYSSGAVVLPGSREQVEAAQATGQARAAQAALRDAESKLAEAKRLNEETAALAGTVSAEQQMGAQR